VRRCSEKEDDMTARPAPALLRRLRRHRRRAVLVAALVLGAAVAGGLAAMLAGFFAVLLVIDALLPVPGASWGEADERFRRVVHERERADRASRLRRRAPARLALLDEHGEWAATERRTLGICAIPIAAITGTVEPAKAREFDARFRPLRGDAERWKQVWLLRARGAAVEPVEVYLLGDAYVVRDGHHRISVALDQGFTEIDAAVTELIGAQAGIGSIASAP
jgi:hypothetical protein